MLLQSVSLITTYFLRVSCVTFSTPCTHLSDRRPLNGGGYLTHMITHTINNVVCFKNGEYFKYGYQPKVNDP